MTPLAVREYVAIRQTIRQRGNMRLIAVLAGLNGWAVLLVAVLVWLPNPIATTVPLLVLAGTFELVRTLNLGVERMGRYLQVFFEEASDGQNVPFAPPAWERTAMVFGPTVPGAGGHPLFLPLFLLAALLNLLGVVLPGPVAIELALLGLPHGAFVVWLLICDRSMRRQRRSELERFRELRRSSAPRASAASAPPA